MVPTSCVYNMCAFKLENVPLTLQFRLLQTFAEQWMFYLLNTLPSNLLHMLHCIKHLTVWCSALPKCRYFNKQKGNKWTLKSVLIWWPYNQHRHYSQCVTDCHCSAFRLVPNQPQHLSIKAARWQVINNATRLCVTCRLRAALWV